ncbi:GspH/FimT family pseudopilin [Sphaerotilaceae bacterium SBD11-9]
MKVQTMLRPLHPGEADRPWLHLPVRGFTLIELMVTIAVLAILLGIGVPSFSRILASNRMATQTNEIVGGLNLARSEAVRRGLPVAIRAVSTNGSYSGGWLVFTDANSDGARANTDESENTDGTLIRQNDALAGRTTIQRVTRSGTSPAFTYADDTSTDAQFLVFNARGGNNRGAAAFFRICDAGSTSTPGRIVQVAVSGKVSLDSTNATCS